MNALIGYSGTDGPDDRNGKAWADQAYRQYLKQADFRAPANTWVTLDEHPDSNICDFVLVRSTERYARFLSWSAAAGAQIV